MDQEIRTDKKKYLSFNLHTFDNKLILNAIKQACLNIHSNHLHVLDYSGSLDVIFLDRKEVHANRSTIERVHSYFTANQNLFRDQKDVCLFIVSEDWHFTQFKVGENPCQIVFSAELHSVLDEDLEIESAEIVAGFEDYICLCINNQTIISLTCRDKQLKRVGDIRLEDVSLLYKPYCIDGKKCAVLNGTKSAFIYDLIDCKQKNIVNIEDVKIEEDFIQHWSISLDSNKIIFAMQDGSLRFIDLNAAERHKGIKSFTASDKSTDRSIGTCKYGDKAWRERLGRYHHKQSDISSQHKTRMLLSNQAKVKSILSKNVSGFRGKRKQTSDFDDWFIPAPDGTDGYCVDDICIDPTCISMVYTYNEVSVLCQWIIRKKKWTQIRCQPNEKVLLSRIPSLPHSVLTSQNLVFITTDSSMGQEELVNELMVYGGASLADKVCHINKWGRSTIPINTLDAGLKHRQIDTVSFFLKSKENFFSGAKSNPNSSDATEDSPYWASNYNYLEHLHQLDPAFNLLFQNVRDSMGDKHSQIFGRQVLDITMDFLYGLLLDGLEVAERLTESKEKEDLNQATEKLLVHIEEARTCVRQYEEKGSVSVSRTGSVSADSISGASLSIYSEDIIDYGREPDISEESFGEWVKMDLETVIEDGILTNQIPALQHYLHYRGDHSQKGFGHIKSAGLKFAVNYIKYDNIQKAKELVTKLGLNVAEKLWEIALHCLDMKLCSAITTELLRMSALTKRQVSMVTFLKQLQEIYPRKDFQTLKTEHVHVKDSESHEVHRIKALINPSPVIDLTEECGNLTARSEDEQSGDIHTDRSRYYSEVVLNWVANWDKTTRDWIRLDVLLYQIGSDISSFKLEVVWDYMQMNNLAKVMVAWIHKTFLDNSYLATPRDQSEWPVSHLGPIPPEFVNRTEFCADFTRRQVWRSFAKYGIFTDEALNNFETLLKHVNTAGGLLRTPHPLSNCKDVNLDEFHINLTCHCVQNNLADYLWTYCNIHRISVELLHEACTAEVEDTWLPLFVHFYSVSRERNEWKKAMLECSLMNATMVTGQEVAGVGDLIQNGHVITAMATLMYSPHQLNQVTFVTQQLETFDGLCSETVERAIQMYPKLHLTLFPASTTDSPQSDVSMYHLLQGNSPFDPTRLFGWQTTNTCVGEDADKQMPYFSNPALVSKHGYTEQLRYTYFLRQGRPSFAYISFLHEEFKNGGPTLSSKRFAVAIGTSMCIAIKNFNHPHISSACVMFQELLGHDSLLLRTYLQVGNEILIHRNNAVTGPMEKRREQTKHNETEVVDLLLRSLQSIKRHAVEVLQALEAAILAGITKDRLSSTSFESGQRWIVAILFCHLMGLPYTTVFLETCAQTNQWLSFIWFSQMHQYSKEQLLGLLHYFKSHHLQEHLQYVIVNASNRSTQEIQKKASTKKRSDLMAKDVRMTLYSKIGLKDRDSDMSTTSDEEETHTFPIQQESNIDEGLEYQITYDGCPGDVFGVVFAAQTSKCPWKSLLVYSVTLKNPLFAELAACMQNTQTLHCLCGWLVAMMEVTDHTNFLEDYGKLPWQYHLEHLDKIIDIYITNKWGSLLVTGFDIFQQNSPLLPFLQFYAEFTERRNFAKCRLYLNEFKQSFFQFHNEKVLKTSIVIGDSSWLEKTTYRIINYLLTSTSNMYEVTELLRILDSESITLVFKSEDPDYRKQFNMMRCLQAANLRSVNLDALLSGTGELSKQECVRVISHLTDKQLFEKARNFASIAGIPADHVTLAQMRSQKEVLSTSELWKNKHSRVNFYKNCIELANKHSVSSQQLTQFFLSEADLMENCCEQAALLEMCLNYMESDETMSESSSSWTEIYKKMCRNKIQEQVEINEDTDFRNKDSKKWADDQIVRGMTDKRAKQELICVGKMPSRSSQSTDLSEKEIQALLTLVGNLLKEGMISEGCRVTSVFDVYSQDLAITLTFIRMSLGVMGMENLSSEMMNLLRTPLGNVHRQSIMAPVALLRNSSTISLMSNIQPLIESVTEETEQKISAMEILLNHCEHSKNTCIRILTAFKIAVVLEMGYDDVVTGDDYIILGSLLKTSCTAKFRLAADFLGTSSLSSEEVAGFLSDAILRSFKVSLGQPVGSQALVIDPGEGFSDFHQIIRLCKNPSILGQRLVDTIAAMTVDVEEISDKVLTLQTEVLILAHDCYTAACDMEGISNILRAARILTAHLEASSEFQLMTRLLTGVGRYNEMIYIFDSLKQNHQFELLLGKGMEKESKLKTAILDYLKRYHPGDNETYSMVALKFMMYREIAQLLNDNANKILDTFKRKPLENNNDTQSSLQKAAQYYSEAAESFIKDSCLRQAQNCVRRARLVALQLKNLASNQVYINLTVKGANVLIADHPVFSEAYIISEAYQQKESWAMALCNNVIIQGDMKYLQEFRSHIRITPQLVEDAVEKYQQSPNKSPQSTNNVKKLLQYCKDVKLQYRIAKSLGLRDVVTGLEKGEARSYIMDFAPQLT